MNRIATWLLIVFATVCVVSSGAGQATACVGKTLVIGTTPSAQQQLLAEIVSLLISERTGTTVKIERFEGADATHQAQMRAEVDITIGYTGEGWVRVLQQAPADDAQAVFDQVKERYNKELNLIWLQPFGFEHPSSVSAERADQVAPVVRKDTLKKFPALARLINKLGGAIDNENLDALDRQAQERAMRDVARDFLRDNRLI
ncbi:MAG: glycine betaine ABC transporter substrate-binding protein [Thermodesulfobacteriota bacterium]|jgi:osmoprotectant transport system substrate-binding protein|nr:glycine betaine ABC transporter substrate-binding protein [Thermodesulfobacteriota bacterium]